MRATRFIRINRDFVSLLVSADVGGGWQTPTPEVDWNAAAQRTLSEALAARPNENVARNVILFLGDGMGIATVTAGRIYAGQKQGRPGEEYQLAFDKFPNVALAKVVVIGNSALYGLPRSSPGRKLSKAYQEIPPIPAYSVGMPTRLDPIPHPTP